MVVGDQHVQALGLRVGHAFEAGNAVVHRHQQIRAALQRQVHDGRREAVAVHGPVGHHVAQALWRSPQQAQAAQGHGAGGGAVAVVIGHHDDALARLDHIGQHAGRLGRTLHGGGRQEMRQTVIHLGRGAHAARGQQASHQGVHAGLLQGKAGARRGVPGLQAGGRHRASRQRSTAAMGGGRQARRRRCQAVSGRGVRVQAWRSPHRLSLTG